MKKITGLAMAAVICLCGCASDKPAEKVIITNDVELVSTPADMTVYEWIEGEIADFREITFAESLRLFEEGGSGIVYYGYDDCPWCERAVPVLNEAARETEITVYYVDVYGVFQPTREQFDKLLTYIEDALVEDDAGEKSFFVPLMMGVKDGVMTDSHVALVDGFVIEEEDDQMTDAQKKTLKDIYLDIIRKTAD